MNARIGHYRLLWQAALHLLPWRAMLLMAVLLSLPFIGIVISSAGAGGSAWIGWIFCAPASFLLLVWAMAYVPGAQKLSTPANAQLVPGMRARLVELTLLVWLAGMGLLAAGLYLVFGVAAAGVWMAVCMTLGVALGMSGSLAGIVLFLPLVMVSIGSDVLPEWLLAAACNPAVVASMVIALGGLAVQWLFPRSGERNRAMTGHRARIVGAGIGTVAQGGARRSAIDGWLLRRAIGKRDPRALLMAALGRNVVAAMVLSVGCTTLALAVLVHLGEQGRLGQAVEGGLMKRTWVTVSSVLLVFLFQAGMAPVWLAGTTGEQALVRLAPAFPGTPSRFNALLARGQLRQSFLIWAMTSVAAMVLGVAAGLRGATLLQQLGVCCLVLPALPLCLRNHARNDAWHHFAMWAVAVGLGYFGALVGLGGHLLFGLPFWPVALATAFALTTVLTVQRLRLMRAAPFALPAGRVN